MYVIGAVLLCWVALGIVVGVPVAIAMKRMVGDDHSPRDERRRTILARAVSGGPAARPWQLATHAGDWKTDGRRDYEEEQHLKI
jgi:hypothetical protein